MALAGIIWFMTLSCILIGTVNSSTNNVTVTEFCNCWRVQSRSLQGNVCSVLLDFKNCWVDTNSNLSPGQDIISDTELVKFGLTIGNTLSQEWNCSIDNVCRLSFGVGALTPGKRYTATIQPQCDICNNCSSRATEILKVIPTTTVPPATTRKYKPLPHKYLFPTMLIGAIVCVILAFVFVIRRWRQRIHHERKERAAKASLTNLQVETDNNNGRGDNPSPPPRYGTTEQCNGGAHYLNMDQKQGFVNDGFEYKN